MTSQVSLFIYFSMLFRSFTEVGTGVSTPAPVAVTGRKTATSRPLFFALPLCGLHSSRRYTAVYIDEHWHLCRSTPALSIAIEQEHHAPVVRAVQRRNLRPEDRSTMTT